MGGGGRAVPRSRPFRGTLGGLRVPKFIFVEFRMRFAKSKLFDEFSTIFIRLQKDVQ